MFGLLRKKSCSHTFRLMDLEKTGIEPPEKPKPFAGFDAWHTYFEQKQIGDHHTKRVRWPCSKCGKIFYAHCGLEISPEYGPVVEGLRTPEKPLATPPTPAVASEP